MNAAARSKSIEAICEAYVPSGERRNTYTRGARPTAWVSSATGEESIRLRHQRDRCRVAYRQRGGWCPLKMAARGCWLAHVHEDDLRGALAPLLAFMGRQPLTRAIAELEASLGGRRGEEVSATIRRHDVSPDLLRSAFVARERFGRINDVIHATAIVLALPSLFDDDEVLKRPSLAAGNDPSRPFDIETNRRVAEFKFSRWDGHDAGESVSCSRTWSILRRGSGWADGPTVCARFAANHISPDNGVDGGMGTQPNG